MVRKIIKLVFVNLMVLLALLLVVEIVLRIMGYGYSNSPADPDPVLHHVHPADYFYKVYTPGGEFGDFTVYYDSLRRRSPLPGNMKTDSAKKTVAVLGDSFVEALQVPYDSSFVGLLARRFPDTRFLNYGVTGYSPVIHYLQCKKMLSEHKVIPDAVLMVLYSNDVREDSGYVRRAYFSKPGNQLAGVRGRKVNAFNSLARKLYLARVIRKSMVKWEYRQKNKNGRLVQGVMVHGLLEESLPVENSLTAEYILKTDSLLKKHGIPLYLAVIPSRYINFTGDTSFVPFSTKLQAWAMDSGLPCISPDGAFNAAAIRGERLFYNIDVHFNPAGHRVMASVLEERMPRILHFK